MPVGAMAVVVGGRERRRRRSWGGGDASTSGRVGGGVGGIRGRRSCNGVRDVRAYGLLDVYRSLDVPTTANRAARARHDDEDEEDADVCPVDCVEELTSIKDFRECVLLARSTKLVVLDLYKPSCGACKYILRGYAKLCKREGSAEKNTDWFDRNVVFYKHNVMDEVRLCVCVCGRRHMRAYEQENDTTSTVTICIHSLT